MVSIRSQFLSLTTDRGKNRGKHAHNFTYFGWWTLSERCKNEKKKKIFIRVKVLRKKKQKTITYKGYYTTGEKGQTQKKNHKTRMKRVCTLHCECYIYNWLIRNFRPKWKLLFEHIFFSLLQTTQHNRCVGTIDNDGILPCLCLWMPRTNGFSI